MADQNRRWNRCHYHEVLPYSGKYTSLALDSQGRPGVTYYAEGIQDLKYAKWDGNKWDVQEAVPLTTDGVEGSFSSLAVSAGGDPGFSMYDEVNRDLVYAEKHPNTGGITMPQPWLDVSMEKVDVRGDVGRYNSLALSSENVPYIAYYDATNRVVKCAWKEQPGWQSAWRSPWKITMLEEPHRFTLIPWEIRVLNVEFQVRDLIRKID